MKIVDENKDNISNKKGKEEGEVYVGVEGKKKKLVCVIKW